VHYIVLESVPALPSWVPGYRPLTLVLWIAVTLGVSHLTYTFIEQPGVRLGRTVATWARTRFARPATGPDGGPVKPAVVIPSPRPAADPALSPPVGPATSPVGSEAPA
jgi:hypothetical protein